MDIRLQVLAVSKGFSGTQLFRNVHMELASGHRVAVIGANGSGKSTLLQIIAGQVAPDEGRVQIQPPNAGIGYAWQELDTSEGDTPLFSWVSEVIPSWQDLWHRWGEATEERTRQKLAQEQAQLEHTYGYNPEHRIQSVLTGLGFPSTQWEHPLRYLSGGWQERAKLARLLVQGTDILLLDEPTNHLDLEAVYWLENFLIRYQGIVVFVAHDRFFLDRVGNRVLALDQGKAVFRPGTFSQYLDWDAEQKEQRLRQVDKLDQSIQHRQRYVDRFRYKADKAKQAQSRLRQVQQLQSRRDSLAPAPSRKVLNFAWPEPPRSNHTVFKVVDMEFAYPGQQSLWPPLNFHLFRGQKVALVGPNGCGKSTLLQIMAKTLSPGQGGVKTGSNVRLGYFTQHIRDTLHLDRSVLAEIRRLADPGTKEEELRSVLGLFLLGESMWERPVRDLSGGEKNRLLLSSLFLARANCLLLDEPTNHLDLESREALILALRHFPGTICLVAHDRYLLSQVPDQIWMLTRQGLQELPAGYAQYEELLQNGEGSDLSVSPPGVRSKDAVKEKKRLEAQRRNERFRRLQPKKKQYAHLEQELEQVLREQNRLEDMLADPQTYAQGSDPGALNKQYMSLQERAEAIFQDLELLEGEIEQLEENEQSA
ncbi:MAG: ATP-binding cassette domain-containing protein [Desulfovermiculus sp.]|nr:ATP-binding cassette domain-containing protein [Desulfovermiculus sp.]